MRKSVLAAALAAIALAVGPSGLVYAQPAEEAGVGEMVTGEISAVTVYRGEALVTRTVPIEGPAGEREVVVGELPARLEAGSLYAEGGEGVEVRSVRYRTRPVRTDVREEVRELEERMDAVREELDRVQRHQELAREQKAHLDKLEEFVAPTASVELTQGVLDTGTLTELSRFIFEQRQEVAETDLDLSREAEELQEEIRQLERERAQITGRSERTVREAVMFLNVVSPEGGEVWLRYLVKDAEWAPSYTLRADTEDEEVTVEYHASVKQMSGEDWDGVAMTLSTASPSLVARAPSLDPLEISMREAPPERVELGELQKQLMDDRADAARLRGQQVPLAEPERAEPVPPMEPMVDADMVMRRGAVGGMGVARPRDDAGELAEAARRFDMRLNTIAGNLQLLDLFGEPEDDAERRPRRPEQELTVTYELPGRTSLPSRDERHFVQIAAMPMEGAFYRLAMPVLTHHVYEEARVTNDSGRVLLAGPISAYRAGEFVGHDQMETVTRGQSLTAGLGIDSAFRTERELTDKDDRIQGGNRVAEFTYRLTLENFSEEDGEVRLLDRLPHTNNDEIRVELTNTTHDLSEAEEYQEQREKGLLRWDVTVPGRSVEEEAFTVEYTFTIEHDRQKTVSGLEDM